MPLTSARHRHRRPWPTWLIIIAWATVTIAAIIWASSLYDDRGEPLLDGPVVQLLVGMIGFVGTVLSIVLKNTGEVKHESQPNSGSSWRDSTNRTERTVTAIAPTIDELAGQVTRLGFTVDQIAGQVGRLQPAVEHLERAHRQNASDLGELREDVQQSRAETASGLGGLRKDIGRLTDAVLKEKK